MSGSVTPKDSRTKAKRDETFRQRSSSAKVPAPGATTDLAMASDFGRALADSDFSDATFERHAKMLGDPKLSQSANTQQRANITLQLQRTYGNRYVQRLVSHIQKTRGIALQTKLSVGPADDKYEQEADRVANEVVSMINSAGEPSIQRQAEEEEELQAKPIQRQAEEEEELQAKLLQRQVSAEGGYVGPDVEQSIQSARGGGQSLPDDVRSSMERAFGADFSAVRVHNNAESDVLSTSLNARAFTTGQDIFFKQDEYNPGSSAGKEVLAHELTHVVQQGGARLERIEDNQGGDTPVVSVEGSEKTHNETGLPDRVKSGVESLSGISLDDVNVHYNSSKPGQLDALSYTRGTDIHVGPGQEGQLAHEAWHVVQQKQGRVKPTMHAKGVAINDDSSLEKEAEKMGEKALGTARSTGMDQNQQGVNTAGPVTISRQVTQLNGKPTIRSETTLSAPDAPDKKRTDVGVGEEVTFRGSAAGKWAATGGTPKGLDASDEFIWTAPNRVQAVAIRLTVGGLNASIWMNVIEPNGITATKDSEIAIAAGTAGAGMKLTFTYLPKKVSFGNIEAKEVSGPATNITGYYDKYYSEADLKHDSGDTFVKIGEDNKFDNAQDTASTEDPYTPYEDGTFDWIIPNHFRVETEGGDGKKFTEVTQAFSIDDTGKVKVTKAGAEVERSP